MSHDVVAAARRLATRHRDLGAIVLECANMPPYADAVAQSLALPVFDAVDLIGWFYAGVARARDTDRHGRPWFFHLPHELRSGGHQFGSPRRRDRGLKLAERPHLELADTFAGHAIAGPQLFQSHRIVL